MHKIFLTEEECSIIHGAREIIDVFGGFPSMENGELVSMEIKPHLDSTRYDISLLFNIKGWLDTCRFYANLNPWHDSAVNDPPSTKIRLTFDCVEGVSVDSMRMKPCGEIKFTDKPHKKMIVQDCHPSITPRISRPFSGFGVLRGDEFFVSFFEDEATITARFE